MESSVLLVGFIVGVALIFDFINGFHDAANSVATIVSTRVLSPKNAVLWAAFFNFIAFLFFGLSVAHTIGRGIVDPSVVSPLVVLSALIGAIAWDLITWYYGIPSSSSHALIGGLIGAAIAGSGGSFSVLELSGLLKISVSIVLSPLFGLALASTLMILVSFVFIKRSPFSVDHWFRRLQLVSAGLYSLGHGGNDAQKTMGIITVLLFSGGFLGEEFYVPFWVVISCHVAMGLGTLMGGWRIVRTMGMRLADLKPVSGFCAETAGAITLFLATGLGIPVSTTHTITGSILGAGLIRKPSSVKWHVAGRIVWAWILTIPASALIAAAFQFMTAVIVGLLN